MHATTLAKNERLCGFAHEGLGAHRTAWPIYEIDCPDCGRRTREYGDACYIDDTDGQTIEICNDCANQL